MTITNITIRIALLTVMLGGCEFVSSSHVRVENHSGKPLEGVIVEFTKGHNSERKSIRPGNSEDFISHDYDDGALSIEFTLDKRRRGYDLIYLMPKASVRCTISVFEKIVKKRCHYAVI